MTIKQFKCKDLKPGDILLKFSDQGWMNTIIETMQWLFGTSPGNAEVTHAGLIYDKTHIIEVQQAGVVASDLTKENKPYGYIVFRCKNANIADGAAQFAKILADASEDKHNMKYALVEAVTSMRGGTAEAADKKKLDETLDKILTNQRNDFFCSQIVVFIYQFVAEQNKVKAKDIFKLDAALISPSALGAHLVDSKTFDEVGYLMPNER